MRLLENTNDRFELALQLTSILRRGLTRGSGLATEDVVLYSVFGNALLTIHEYEFKDRADLLDLKLSLLKLVKELPTEVDCSAAREILEIVIAHMDERAKHAPSDIRQL